MPYPSFLLSANFQSSPSRAHSLEISAPPADQSQRWNFPSFRTPTTKIKRIPDHHFEKKANLSCGSPQGGQLFFEKGETQLQARQQ